MTENQFYLADSPFSIDDIRNTGAELDDLDLDAFNKLSAFTKIISSPVFFINNGISTGVHKSAGHSLGKAFDIRVPRKNCYAVFKAAIEAGFKRIGIYWNGNAYTYHLEDSPTASFWSGRKSRPGECPWEFNQLINDPRNLNPVS